MTSSVLPPFSSNVTVVTWPVAARFFIGPDETRVWCHFEVPAVERHGLRGSRVAEHEAVHAAYANIELAGKQGQANDFGTHQR